MKTWLKYGLRTLGIGIGLEIVILIVGAILNIFIDRAFLILNLPFLIAIQFLAIYVLGSKGVMWNTTGTVGTHYDIGMGVLSTLFLLLITFVIGAVIGLIAEKFKGKQH